MHSVRTSSTSALNEGRLTKTGSSKTVVKGVAIRRRRYQSGRSGLKLVHLHRLSEADALTDGARVWNRLETSVPTCGYNDPKFALTLAFVRRLHIHPTLTEVDVLCDAPEQPLPPKNMTRSLLVGDNQTSTISELTAFEWTRRASRARLMHRLEPPRGVLRELETPLAVPVEEVVGS